MMMMMMIKKGEVCPHLLNNGTSGNL